MAKTYSHILALDSHILRAVMPESEDTDQMTPSTKKRDVPPGKIFMGIVIIAALLASAILIPNSQFLIALIVFFGFSGFLDWLQA